MRETAISGGRRWVRLLVVAGSLALSPSRPGTASSCSAGTVGNTLKVTRTGAAGLPDLVFHWDLVANESAFGGYQVHAVPDRTDIHDATNRGDLGCAADTAISMCGLLAAVPKATPCPPDPVPCQYPVEVVYYQVVRLCIDGISQGPIDCTESAGVLGCP